MHTPTCHTTIQGSPTMTPAPCCLRHGTRLALYANES